MYLDDFFSSGEHYWMPGNSLGLLLHTSKYELFEIWKPEDWNSFCIMGDSATNQYKTYLNKKLIFHSTNYDGAHKEGAENIFLLNGYSPSRGKFLYPFQGEVTDLNIWNKTLGTDVMGNWINCLSEESGNVIDWNMAILRLTHVEILNFDKDKICNKKDPSGLIAFAIKMDFFETLKFCKKLGGEVAVANNLEKLQAMVDAFKQSYDGSKCLSKFYSGYRNKNGWRNSNTGEILDWNNWSKNPNKYYNSCASIDTESLKFQGSLCQVELCPICFFEGGLTEIQLRGMSIEQTKDIESQYYLVNSTHLIGKTRSSIIFENSEWHIKTSGRKTVLTTGGDMLPLGVKEWIGTPGYDVNMRLILHQKVEQPGFFCCDDGECIPSEYVCDSVQTCEDNSDERWCHKVIFSKNYNKDTPARSDESQVNPHYHEINTRIKIIDIVWVNQELGEMSLFIKLDFFWYDNSLKFFFLGDQSNNDLNETLEKQIWTPVIDYMYLKNKREVFKKLWIQKLKKPKRSGEIDILQPLELYEGSENSICLEIYERIDVLCSFDRIKDYPFGDDTCIIDIYLNGKDNNHATFHPVKMSMLQRKV